MGRPHLDSHAKAIGYLCIELAELEIGIGGLLHYLGGFKKFEESHVFNAHLELRNKLEVVRALGLMKKPSDIWFQELDDMIVNVKAVCQERNRIVHDSWIEMSGSIYRYRQVRQVKRPQAFQPPALTVVEHVPVTEAEIWKIVERIKEAMFALGWLTVTFLYPDPPTPPPKHGR